MSENDTLSILDCKMLINISKNASNPRLMITDLARICNCNITSPNFYRILTILRKLNIVVVTEMLGSCKFVKINQKKLDNFILSQKELRFFIDWHETNNRWVSA